MALLRNMVRLALGFGTLGVTALADPTAGSGRPLGGWPDIALATPPVLLQATPIVLHVTTLGPEFESASISDVIAADLNGDGLGDIAAAWYATNYDDMSVCRRFVTIFFSDGTSFRRGPDLDLYTPDYTVPARSLFRNGTAAMACADFDDDGDKDLAVTAFFGDEMGLVENLGNEHFALHLRYPFGFNSPANFITPPEAIAGDFDGDGRDELAVLCDPVQYLDSMIVHFWKTTSSIANMQRVSWWAGPSSGVKWTRGLAVTDFDGDGRADLCFSGCRDPAVEANPVVTTWYGLNVAQGLFSSFTETPSLVCSDVAAVRPNPGCRPGLILTGINGATLQHWTAACGGAVDFELGTSVTGYAALSPNRGMTAVVADVNGDGQPDVVTKQKLGTATDHNQIEITLCKAAGSIWTRVSPSPIDTGGFANDPYNEILRPRNLAVADLMGNTLPEIVAGFGASPARGYAPPADVLEVAVWVNSCLGDVDVDGETDGRDLGALTASYNCMVGDANFNPNADLDKNGIVDVRDARILLGDFGCRCAGCGGTELGDMNCDTTVSWRDTDPFVLALSDRAAFEAEYPGCNWLNGDCNGDAKVTWRDIAGFLVAMEANTPPVPPPHAAR